MVTQREPIHEAIHRPSPRRARQPSARRGVTRRRARRAAASRRTTRAGRVRIHRARPPQRTRRWLRAMPGVAAAVRVRRPAWRTPLRCERHNRPTPRRAPRHRSPRQLVSRHLSPSRPPRRAPRRPPRRLIRRDRSPRGQHHPRALPQLAAAAPTRPVVDGGTARRRRAMGRRASTLPAGPRCRLAVGGCRGCGRGDERRRQPASLATARTSPRGARRPAHPPRSPQRRLSGRHARTSTVAAWWAGLDCPPQPASRHSTRGVSRPSATGSRRLTPPLPCTYQAFARTTLTGAP